MLYRGYDGEFRVLDNTLEIVKGDAGDESARRLPLAEIGAVRFVPAGTRASAGWLQALPAGFVQPVPDREAALADPYTVLFEATDEEQFAQLADWLYEVVGINTQDGEQPDAADNPAPAAGYPDDEEASGRRFKILAAALGVFVLLALIALIAWPGGKTKDTAAPLPSNGPTSLSSLSPTDSGAPPTSIDGSPTTIPTTHASRSSRSPSPPPGTDPGSDSPNPPPPPTGGGKSSPSLPVVQQGQPCNNLGAQAQDSRGHLMECQRSGLLGLNQTWERA
jgi:uncharacterized protein DUF4429